MLGCVLRAYQNENPFRMMIPPGISFRHLQVYLSFLSTPCVCLREIIGLDDCSGANLTAFQPWTGPQIDKIRAYAASWGIPEFGTGFAKIDQQKN